MEFKLTKNGDETDLKMKLPNRVRNKNLGWLVEAHFFKTILKVTLNRV